MLSIVLISFVPCVLRKSLILNIFSNVTDFREKPGKWGFGCGKTEFRLGLVFI